MEMEGGIHCIFTSNYDPRNTKLSLWSSRQHQAEPCLRRDRLYGLGPVTMVSRAFSAAANIAFIIQLLSYILIEF